jgi:hypothetical protein
MWHNHVIVFMMSAGDQPTTTDLLMVTLVFLLSGTFRIFFTEITFCWVFPA